MAEMNLDHYVHVVVLDPGDEAIVRARKQCQEVVSFCHFYFLFLFLIPRRADHVLRLLGLDVLLDDVVGRRLLAPVTDDDAGAADDLSRLALGVQLAQAAPFAQLVVGVHLDQRNLMLLAESLDQLLVQGLVAVFGEDAQVSLTLVQGLGTLVQSAGQSVVDESLLQDFLDRRVDVHGRTDGRRCGGCGCGGGGGSCGVISFDVRHDGKSLMRAVDVNKKASCN